MDFRFDGENLIYDLSLGLFSSLAVDSGSKLLLKTLAQQLDLASVERIADIGCGVGVLGLALAKRCPSSWVTMIDRDALALSFTQHNASLNKLRNLNIQSRLMLEGIAESSFDLIVCNFPAKAGDPVLEDYLKRSVDALLPGAVAAIVIVNTLADRCSELIESSGAAIKYRESSKQHSVFHYGCDAQNAQRVPAKSTVLLPYIRYRGTFKLKRTRYELETVWNISDFDTLSWRLKLMGDILDREAWHGRMLFWAPGQGHLPAAVYLRHGSQPRQLTFAGRDRLQLLTSRANLERLGFESTINCIPLAAAELLSGVTETGSIDLLVTDLNPVSRTQWAEPLKETVKAVLAPGGHWACVGRSSDLAMLSRSTSGFTPVNDRRNHGWRAFLFQRNS